MNKQNNVADKLINLIESLLSQCKEGKFELAKNTRDLMNVEFDKVMEKVSGDNATYGESRNFGLIYKVFEENTKHLYATEEGRKTIGKVINLIKEDAVLSDEFAAYNAFTNPGKVSSPEAYVNEALNLVKRHSKSDVVRSNNKLIEAMREAGVNEAVDVSGSDMDLFENIEYVVLNERKLSNIDEYLEVKQFLTESVESNSVEPANMIDTDRAIEEMREKYNRTLTEDEKTLLDDMSADGEKIFNEMKSDILSMLNKEKNNNEDGNIKSIDEAIAKVNGMSYNKDTFIDNLATFTEIKEVLEN